MFPKTGYRSKKRLLWFTIASVVLLAGLLSMVKFGAVSQPSLAAEVELYYTPG